MQQLSTPTTSVQNGYHYISAMTAIIFFGGSSSSASAPSSSDEGYSPVVLIWWAFLSSIAIMNIFLLIVANRTLNVNNSSPEGSKEKDEGHYSYNDASSSWLVNIRNKQFNMSALYVGGCAFRSIFICHHTLRRALLYSFASTGFVGRSVATVAELGAATQVSLLLQEVGISTNDDLISTISKCIVPLLVMAELFSWYACVTTSYIGSIFEESLWAFCALLSMVSLFRAYPRYVGKDQRNFLQKTIIVNLLYFTYMVIIDVPQYIRAHIRNTNTGKEYYNISDGLNTLLNISQHKLSWSYEDWKFAMMWMTLYFSVACWASIGVVNGPRLDRGMMNMKMKKKCN